MSTWSTFASTVLASFLASIVEFVEALTIVLAVGVTRGWKPSLLGTAAGVATLAVLVAAFGSSLTAIPVPALQLAVGVLLLMFGMRWLHKAVLRSAGVIPLHDESLIYSRLMHDMQAEGDTRRAFDVVAFVTAFKAVLLEGIEVVFVVLALGMNSGMLLPASAGASLALVVVMALGIALQQPLAKVPENALKFAVGVMLTSFGTFWAGEGMGFSWPAGEVSVLVLIVAFLSVALLVVSACEKVHAPRIGVKPRQASAAAAPRVSVLSTVLGELLGLFVEDLPLAIGIAVWVAATAAVPALRLVNAQMADAAFPAGLAAVLAASAWRRARIFKSER
jgi:uncharacterized membrane protein